MVYPIIMEQAVFNLADNAVKYGGEDSAVKICVWQAKGQIVIEVADSGPGQPV